MMYPEIATQDLIAKDRIKPYEPTNSVNTEEMDFEELFPRMIFSFNNQTMLGKVIYIDINRLFNIDLSSVIPRFEPTNDTSIGDIVEEDIINKDMLEYDIVVKMPPKNKYSIELEVKNIKKATPKIVEPE